MTIPRWVCGVLTVQITSLRNGLIDSLWILLSCVAVMLRTGDADELGCFYGRWMHLASAAYRGCGSSLAELYQWIMSRLDDEDLATAVVEACQ